MYRNTSLPTLLIGKPILGLMVSWRIYRIIAHGLVQVYRCMYILVLARLVRTIFYEKASHQLHTFIYRCISLHV